MSLYYKTSTTSKRWKYIHGLKNVGRAVVKVNTSLWEAGYMIWGCLDKKKCSKFQTWEWSRSYQILAVLWENCLSLALGPLKETLLKSSFVIQIQLTIIKDDSPSLLLLKFIAYSAWNFPMKWKNTLTKLQACTFNCLYSPFFLSHLSDFCS